jgi:hypothetical protein
VLCMRFMSPTMMLINILRGTAFFFINNGEYNDETTSQSDSNLVSCGYAGWNQLGTIPDCVFTIIYGLPGPGASQ